MSYGGLLDPEPSLMFSCISPYTAWTCDEVREMAHWGPPSAQDIADTQALMKEAGWGPDNRLKLVMMVGSSPGLGHELTKAEYEKIYIDSEFNTYPDARRDEIYAAGDFDIAYNIVIVASGHPAELFSAYFSCDGVRK